ncbi:MAG: Trm112 family protein [Proteobacteria bacterium]|nr:Trm112 family protein [Pseudomonadota bacterium]
MALSQELLELLRCSESKQELIYFPDGEGDSEPFLFCPASRLRYPIGENDLPIMLIEEATRVDEAESARLVAAAQKLGLATPEDAT